MDISYVHTQKRKEFGKPCSFTNAGPYLLAEIKSNPKLQKEFYVVSSVTREVDNSIRMCSHEVNTESFPTENRGMNHVEGGWPENVDIADEDSTARFRKKFDKDKNYVNSVKSLGDFLESFVMENNSIDIYEEYFTEGRFSSKEEGPLNVSFVLEDPHKMARKIIDLSWSLDGSKVAGAYSVSGLPMSARDRNTDSYVWDIKNNVSPYCTLMPEFALNCLGFSPTELDLLLGGYNNGQIGIWDVRLGGHAQLTSDVLESHTAKVCGIKWLETFTRMDAFSTSVDGSMMSWDARNLAKPVQIISLDPKDTDLPSIQEKFIPSCAEYDPTIPDKFMIGTDRGKIVMFDRLTKDSTVYYTQFGSVLAIERNYFFPQLFASCNPSATLLWSEGKTSPILEMTSSEGYHTDISWSPYKSSLLYITNSVGTIELWDVPGKYMGPITSISLEKTPLYSISTNPSDGVIACGSHSGKIYILTPPKCFTSTNAEEIEFITKYIEPLENGKPRHERLDILRQSLDESKEIKLEDTWDAPEAAEDLKIEYETLFKKYPL